MKWKTALTAEEAALWITGLSEHHNSLAEIEEALGSFGEPHPESEFWHYWRDFKSDFNEAVDLASTLWDEINHAWRKQELGEGRGSILVLDTFGYNDEFGESLSEKRCKVTRESLASWVYAMDGLDKAKMIYPNFDSNNLPANSASLNNPVKEEISSNYPKKLQLAIEAHQHVYIDKGFGNRPTNKEIFGWLNEKAIDLGLTYHDDGETCNGISKKVGEVLVQIIKPDEK